MSIFSAKQRMGLAAAIMAASIFLSRFMGLIRDKVISYFHGATIESDIYFASFVVPDFLNYLLAGGYFSITLIPLLAARFEKDEQDGWRFFSAVTSWITLSAALLTGVAWIAAPQLAVIAAPGFDAASSARLAYFLRIILPAQVFFLAGSCFTAMLYMRRQFAVPALTPLIYNACIIGGGLLGIRSGMEGFCWGVLAGAALGSFALPFWAVRSGGLRLFAVLRHKGVRTFALLALPLMIGQSVVVLDEQFVRIFGSIAGEGAVSLLNYARRIMLVPVGVVAQAAGVASYPFLASLAASGDEQRFTDTLGSALRNTMLVIIPVSVWMIVAAEPTMRLIFQQGSFTALQTAASAPLLMVMLAAVPLWGVQQVVGRAFYARQDTVTPAVVGTVATLCGLPAYWLLAKYEGAFGGAIGVAIAGCLSVALYTVILSSVWARRYGGGVFSTMSLSALRVVSACLPAAVAGWWAMGVASGSLLVLFKQPVHPLWDAFAELAASGLAFGIVFLVAAHFVAPEANRMLGSIVKRILRR
ncbi:murein biosynthesis integral membrane protein MurJ [Oleidesulfovibrio sp.]|uniref:murein biosynthesis integral membrane protein MurJ n=1 Tax=Oleidesulfovibrio sp. TaxID=2909707 RepID=UPI003A8963BA